MMQNQRKCELRWIGQVKTAGSITAAGTVFLHSPSMLKKKKKKLEMVLVLGCLRQSPLREFEETRTLSLFAFFGESRLGTRVDYGAWGVIFGPLLPINPIVLYSIQTSFYLKQSNLTPK